MDIISLGVETRNEIGKGPARRHRRSGRIPVVVYRAGELPINLTVDPAELDLKLRKIGNRNTLIRVEAGGTERLCLLKEVQRHPLSHRLLHADFYEVRKDTPVEVNVRVETTGRSIGTRKGGRINLVRGHLMVRCLPEAIPACLELDVTNLDLGDSIRVADIVPPTGVQILFEQNFNVVVVSGIIAEEDDAPAAGGEASAASDK